MKPDPLTRAFIELDEQGEVVKSRPYPERPLSMLMMRRDVAFTASPFRFRNSARINISVPSARNLISMI